MKSPWVIPKCHVTATPLTPCQESPQRMWTQIPWKNWSNKYVFFATFYTFYVLFFSRKLRTLLLLYLDQLIKNTIWDGTHVKCKDNVKSWCLPICFDVWKKSRFTWLLCILWKSIQKKKKKEKRKKKNRTKCINVFWFAGERRKRRNRKRITSTKRRPRHVFFKPVRINARQQQRKWGPLKGGPQDPHIVQRTPTIGSGRTRGISQRILDVAPFTPQRRPRRPFAPFPTLGHSQLNSGGPPISGRKWVCQAPHTPRRRGRGEPH